MCAGRAGQRPVEASQAGALIDLSPAHDVRSPTRDGASTGSAFRRRGVVRGLAAASEPRIQMPETEMASDAGRDPGASGAAMVPAADGRDDPGKRAELSNLEIVRHYFDLAADRLRLADDLRVVFWTPY